MRAKFKETGLYLINNESVYEAERAKVLLTKEQDGKNCNITPLDFMHGHCESFAVALNQLFGYSTYRLMDDDFGQYLHSFCLVKRKGLNYYIDVRGITCNYEKFLSEYTVGTPSLVSAPRLKLMMQIPQDNVEIAKECIRQNIEIYRL